MFRLHIDVPLGEDESKAVEASKFVASLLEEAMKDCDGDNTRSLPEEVKMFQYRLGNDNDRTIKNYLVKTENGHVTKNKLKVYFKEVENKEELEVRRAEV